MTVLGRDGEILADLPPCLPADDDAPEHAFLAAATALIDQPQWLAGDHCKGIWLDNDIDVESLDLPWERLSLIALTFPVFTDGRAYSQAQVLRTRLDYSGQLAAVGDVLRDQLFYMIRAGIDCFSLRADQSIPACLAALNDFNLPYLQSARSEPGVFATRRKR